MESGSQSYFLPSPCTKLSGCGTGMVVERGYLWGRASCNRSPKHCRAWQRRSLWQGARTRGGRLPPPSRLLPHPGDRWWCPDRGRPPTRPIRRRAAPGAVVAAAVPVADAVDGIGEHRVPAAFPQQHRVSRTHSQPHSVTRIGYILTFPPIPSPRAGVCRSEGEGEGQGEGEGGYCGTPPLESPPTTLYVFFRKKQWPLFFRIADANIFF